ncbi:MAG: Gfo/Idh/MocA family oxidoreductase [Treponema sp.]|jgi:predicted dehydrogenase|nr:Gfo/Idh/MocA family oxidoreductase [Treponema sp.]
MKVGILGAGNIAGKMAQTLVLMGTEASAVASRDLGKARAFADKFHVKTAYGSYEELYQSDVDLVYVATPHSHHYAQMRDCLENGKHVLCEKAFTINTAQAREILELGRRKGLLVAEAIWTRYMPMRKVMDEILASRVVGRPMILTANLDYVSQTLERLIRPELAGGALLDLGVYTINFALMCFGSSIKRIESTFVPFSTGVDAMSNTTLVYDDDRMAMIHSSMMCRSDRRGMVFGEKGYIEFININNCEGIRVFDANDRLINSYETPKQLTGFEYQVTACERAITTGLTECPEMPHSEILKVMEIMDKIRGVWGVKYPEET